MNNHKVGFEVLWTFECKDKDGKLKWKDENYNLVVNQGLQDILDVYFLSSSQSANWYIGLTDSSPTIAAGDTLASHVGWVEITDYAGNRQTYTSVRTAQTLSNTASKASFAINNTVTVGGGFLCDVNSGSAGILFSGVALSEGNRSMINGDTLEITCQITAADDGV